MKEAREITRRRRQVESGERGGSPEDRDALLLLIERLERDPGKRGVQRRRTIIQHAVTMAEEVGGIARLTDDRDAVDTVLDWINQSYAPPDGDRLRDGTTTWNTWHDYRKDLRTVGTVLNGGTLPETMEHVSLKTPGNTRSDVKARDLPEPKHIQARMDACSHPRDKAAVALMFDPALRPKAALWKLRCNDVEVRTDGRVILHVREDKNNAGREVEVFWEPARDAVRTWLEYHPSEDDDAYLWSPIHKPGHITYKRFADVIKRAADDSDTSHLARTPKLYQRANARWLTEDHGIPLSVVNQRHGRRPDSDHTVNYLAQHDADDQARVWAGGDRGGPARRHTVRLRRPIGPGGTDRQGRGGTGPRDARRAA